MLTDQRLLGAFSPRGKAFVRVRYSAMGLDLQRVSST
jgi:hypothetical protein